MWGGGGGATKQWAIPLPAVCSSPQSLNPFSQETFTTPGCYHIMSHREHMCVCGGGGGEGGVV